MLTSFLTTSSANLRPIRRFTAATVLAGLVTAWRLADCPTNTSPSFVKATIDGVVRSPSLFSITLGLPPSMMATQEFVVPRSMPIILPIVKTLSIIQTDDRYVGEVNAISIALPGRFTDDDAGRTQQAAIERIALLNHTQHRIDRLVPALLRHHGFVPGRVERLAGRIDDLDARLLECPQQLAQRGLRPLDQRGTRVGRTGRDARFEGIADGDQILGEAL